MANKRKTIQRGTVSQTAMKRRFSKRLGNVIVNEDTTIGVTEPSKKNQLKEQTNKAKSVSNKTKQANSELVIGEIEQNTNSMSIDSVHNSDTNEATSTSMDESSISSNDDSQLKPATRHSINTNDDDDNDEFCRLFMSNTSKFNNIHNYNSTPLCASRKNDKSVPSTASSSLSHRVKDNALDRLSTSLDNHYSNGSDLHTRNISTPTNPHLIGGVPQSQTPSSIRSLCSVTATSNNVAILETFTEYRNLKRDYERASKQNGIWAADYQALTRRMKRLEQSTFPRPSADGYAFIEQLLHSLRINQGDEDNRTNADLARDLGLSEATLMSLSNTDPQKTSLRLFNTLFPNNQDKEALFNVAHLSVQFPNLLNNVLVFARRCSPGCGYTNTMLKEAIGNSIRCARHNMKKANVQKVAAVAIQETQIRHGIDHINDI